MPASPLQDRAMEPARCLRRMVSRVIDALLLPSSSRGPPRFVASAVYSWLAQHDIDEIRAATITDSSVPETPAPGSRVDACD